VSKMKSSSFRKVDLHIHTPKSECYNNKSIIPEQIVEVAMTNSLEAIAITDHNTVEAVEDIRKIARKNGLFVFPGVELSTKSGHVIAIFELDTPVEKLEDFLDYTGIARKKRGDAHILTDGGMVEVFQKIDERGAIAIAAHIDRWPSGFLETNESRKVKKEIHSSNYLSALEITIPQNKQAWNNGQVRDFPKRYACIQGSDAHDLNEIARRPVYIEMETVGLEALKRAFIEYETKILFPDEFSENK
jgi:PHP family Zn ribbon phosphoesterase